MKRIAADLLIVFLVLLGGSTRLKAQGLTADRFLDSVSAHPVGDQVERDQSAEAYQALNTASPAEAQRVLPILLHYTRIGNEVHAREYAAGFLIGIAMRPDGADLLSSKSEEISSLIVDADPVIQGAGVAITPFLIAKAGTTKQVYMTALEAGIQKTQTPQDRGLDMVGLLLGLSYGSSDPGTLKPVLDFMHRDDLTANTRRELVHRLGTANGLPEPVNQSLLKELDDPDPTVRVAAVVAFADSTTRFHALAKDRVEKMASDPGENPKIRELAKEAIAGKTGLNPNVLVPNVEVPPDGPKDH